MYTEPVKYDPASGPEILLARDERAARQKEWLHGQSGCCLISATMNIAGTVKNSPLIEKCFQLGTRAVEDTLNNCGAPVLKKGSCSLKTGPEALFLVKAEAAAVKKMMIGVEQALSFGRLLDLDVLNNEGVALSREELGFAERQCLICTGPAPECSRSGRHPPEEIQKETGRILREALSQNRADEVASLCCRALLYEVLVTPKPGLVDRSNAGSHDDMDIFSFAASAAGLTPFFRKAYLLGIRDVEKLQPDFLTALRTAGRLAEEDMKRATNGANTHKGLIYSLGLICGALGKCEARETLFSLDEMLACAASLAQETVSSDFTNTSKNESFGIRLYAQTGEKGVRGEAAAGFPTVRFFSLPLMEELRERGLSINDAGAYTLLALLGRVIDTNMISRGGEEAAKTAREAAAALWKETGELSSVLPSMDALSDLDGKFIKQRLSPGGCGDLLAITFMLYFYKSTYCRLTEWFVVK